MIKILFCAMKYDYGRPQQGLSVEYTNFYDTLRHMEDIEVEFFATDELTQQFGRDGMNARLIQKVEEKKPDLLFCYLLTEELKKSTIGYITTKTKTKTFNWFADDHWRIPVFSRYWAPLFTLVSTTDPGAPAKYRSYGITNVIKTQWAANSYLYQPQPQSKNPGDYIITFVGKKFGKRGGYIENLKRTGLPVRAFGGGWEEGRVSQQQMLEIFSFSKINLNFTETHYYGLRASLNLLGRLFVKKEFGRYRFNAHHFLSNLQAAKGTKHLTIKGRVFEIAACGGFVLTGKSDDDISEYYTPDKEIVIFKNRQDLVEKGKYYLEHEEKRRAIAKAGFERTVKDHTYVSRFNQIFSALGLK